MVKEVVLVGVVVLEEVEEGGRERVWKGSVVEEDILLFSRYCG